ncbi:hypothetical protein VB773_00075 [Haloarculaceae archaeon H-GB2-1]|nr:hypothetical protein [Haloarculaceae archaeon H-GB1-1]MEA5406130.1 hypothetical protein [Haloarculaceae archaeon H-GB2-1]
MRTKLAALAVAVLLVIGTGSVVAAMDPPTTDTASDYVLPVNYTIDVFNPGEESDEEVDQAIETAWVNHTVRSYFDEGAAVHFEVWATGSDEDVMRVKVAPIKEPDEKRVIAEVDLPEQQVTSTDEPEKLNASNAITINISDYDLNDTEHNQDTNSEGTATQLTDDQATQIELNETSIERGVNGLFTFEAKDENETSAAVSSDEIRPTNTKIRLCSFARRDGDDCVIAVESEEAECCGIGIPPLHPCYGVKG